MQDIFSKLNSLKSIEPDKNWVVDAKKRVLSEAPVFGRESVLKNILLKVDSRFRGNDKARILDKKSNLGFNFQDLFQNLSFKKLMIPAFSLVFVLFTGVFTFNASDSSLPGEILYSLKMAKENVILAIAPENKKAEIEMQQVGKRLEEFNRISENYSDPKQGEKIGMILGEIKVKTNRAEEHLTEIEDNVVKIKVAKVVGAQGEKYAEVLVKTTENLPTVIGDEIIEEATKAIDSSEKIYLTSFAVITEGKETVDGAGEEDKDDSAEDGEEITDTEEDTEEEPLVSDGDNDSEEGDVKGDEDENNQLDPVDDVNKEDLADEDADKSEDSGEVVSEEMEEVIQEEVSLVE